MCPLTERYHKTLVCFVLKIYCFALMRKCALTNWCVHIIFDLFYRCIGAKELPFPRGCTITPWAWKDRPVLFVRRPLPFFIQQAKSVEVLLAQPPIGLKGRRNLPWRKKHMLCFQVGEILQSDQNSWKLVAPFLHVISRGFTANLCYIYLLKLQV